MLRYRKLVLLATIVVVLGTISSTLAYALRLHTDGYRRDVEASLSRLLKLDVHIGAIEPLTTRTRQFDDISLRLAKRRVEVFNCARAVWRKRPVEGQWRYDLDLHDGWLLVGSGEWEWADYDRLLHSGLGHDFAALHVEGVHLHNIDLRWTHPDLDIMAPACAGDVRFDERGNGRATLTTDQLNAVRVDQPVNILADFTPGERLQFHRVVLNVPQAPLRALGLDRLLGGPLTGGTFAGSISYQQRANGPVATVAGRIRDAALAEFTRKLTGGPFDGVIDVQVDEAVFADRRLRSLRFNGRLDDLDLAQFGPLVGVPELEGRIDLRVNQAHVEGGLLRYLRAEGGADGLPLGVLTDLLCRGRITGTMSLDIDSLLIVDGQLVSANVKFDAVPPEDAAGTIDRTMLQTASQQLLGLDATTLLPPSITEVEYVRLGARLVLNDGELRVQGTHGDDGRTILSIRLFSRDLGVIKEPKQTYRIDAFLESIRQRIERYDRQDLRDWWRARGLVPRDGDSRH